MSFLRSVSKFLKKKKHYHTYDLYILKMNDNNDLMIKNKQQDLCMSAEKCVCVMGIFEIIIIIELSSWDLV